MKTFFGAISALAILGLGGCATPTQVHKQSMDEFSQLTRQGVQQCSTVKDDRLETAITFSTLNCFQRKNGILKVVWDDNFIRVYKDKKTGALKFQVYTVLYYKDWLFPMRANFGVESVQSVDGDRVAGEVDCSQHGLYGYCMHEEHFVFELPLDEILKIEQLAAKQGGVLEWKYRLKTKSGVDADRILNANEILGVFDLATGYSSRTAAVTP